MEEINLAFGETVEVELAKIQDSDIKPKMHPEFTHEEVVRDSVRKMSV